MTTPYDTFTAARLVNQSMPISYFMKTEALITFEMDDYIDDIKDVMASKRHRDFPILDKNGRYRGMISRRNLLGAKGKRIILVDHNERSQAVEGMESAEILEIIDHHRLGTVETIAPVFFRNQPVGCTATIVYQMYQENRVEIEPWVAGLLCSAIISDTLLFRSPTCTDVDKRAALHLAEIAGVEVETYASAMFAAGSNLKGKTDVEIFYQDFKKFSAGEVQFGVGQITSLDARELKKIHARLSTMLTKAKAEHGLDMIFFMLTNILDESTLVLCSDEEALSVASRCFGVSVTKDGDSVFVDNMVSRKKQFIPKMVGTLQE